MYSKISLEWKLDIMGDANQLLADLSNYDIHSSYSYRSIPFMDKFQENLKFPPISLNKSAKLTDWMSIEPSTGDFLILSEKAIGVITKFKLPEYQIKELPILDVEKKYYAFHFVEVITKQIINWEESSFVLSNKIDWNNPNSDRQHYEYKELKFPSEDEYKAEKIKYENSKYDVYKKRLVISEQYNYDLAKHISFLGGTIVSEKLKEVISKSLTGFNFRPLTLDWSNNYIKKEL